MIRLLILFILCFSSPVFAGGVMFDAGGVESGGETWEHILAMDDDLATTVVLNTGTDGTSWTASVNTDVMHSATAKEGSGSFNLAANGRVITSPAVWTATKFTYQTWYYFTNASAVGLEYMSGVNDGTGGGTNEYELRREIGESNLKFRCRGNDTTLGEISTTDFTPSTSTWYSIKIVIDATQSPWAITASYGTDEASMTTLTLGSWSANPITPIFADAFTWGTVTVNDPQMLIDNARLRAD